ncbi:MAG: FAD-binding oxidoreductase [Alphaproteobacteria bacterium]|nr:FAD-binding oxidoreductase [Alphaproteobacteria bacterium]
MNDARDSRTTDLASAFGKIIGDANIITDAAERDLLSHDVFVWDDIKTPVLVLRPGSATDISEIVKAAPKLGVNIAIRGGGMSYTQGYPPVTAPTVLLDMRRLDRLELHLNDRYVLAGVGCTWERIHRELMPHGFVADYQVPMSGIVSTVGGALSQNVPLGQTGVLGLEVVRVDGGIVHTGSWAHKGGDGPYHRNYGPDLTGIFLGDNGAYGIKTAAGLHICQKPTGKAFAAFDYTSYEDLAATMIEIAPFDFVNEHVGLDPYESRNIARVSYGKAFEAAQSIISDQSGVVGKITQAAKLAATGASAGTNFLANANWTLHLKSTSITNDAAEFGLEQVRVICAKRGTPIPDLLPRARDVSGGFSIRKFLGVDGERWVATNSIFPIGRAVDVATKIQGFFATKLDDMKAHKVGHGFVTNYGPTYFLCEPTFYWVDEVSPLHLRHLPPDEAERFCKIPADPKARRFVQSLRKELTAFFFKIGATHLQLAKAYPYREAIEPETWRLAKELKALLDPDRRLNPHNLGFVPGAKD